MRLEDIVLLIVDLAAYASYVVLSYSHSQSKYCSSSLSLSSIIISSTSLGTCMYNAVLAGRFLSTSKFKL